MHRSAWQKEEEKEEAEEQETSKVTDSKVVSDTGAGQVTDSNKSDNPEISQVAEVSTGDVTHCFRYKLCDFDILVKNYELISVSWSII